MECITQICTCDDQCDTPCPMHFRENALQDALLRTEQCLENTKILMNMLIEHINQTQEIARIIMDYLEGLKKEGTPK